MFTRLKKLDVFSRNIIIVFSGSCLVNFFNLLYQLIIAHRLTAIEFASFNSLLAVFMLVTTPFGTLQMALTKYIAGFNARGEPTKIKFLISDLSRKVIFLSVGFLFIFLLFGQQLTNLLKIPASASGYVLAFLIASTLPVQVFTGAIQGLELFISLAGVSVASGLLKLALSVAFIALGYGVAGALGAFLLANLCAIVILYYPLRNFFSCRSTQNAEVNYKEIIVFLFPVALSYFCWIAMVSLDMILVKYFFSLSDAGIYSLAQMVGKIFLFLPGAISVVLFPKTSGLSAKKLDTSAVLKKSLYYCILLGIPAVIIYNLLPGLILQVLTGKAGAEAIFLGRLFSISMSLFAALYIIVAYFLSIKDFRFIKYLVCGTLAQFSAILLLHASLTQVQVILCVNSALLLGVHLFLAFRRK
ncbi:MAG: oligosaccharide flippase family protein [Candidatus Omnitrophica bacterium]|jgi:O-antigen/teichoic acid export membrane protein|nr:oligosaccharide flippase family protein [Candidatus Omnitrophota bacterium]